MKRFAATALGLLTACGGTNVAPGPADGSSGGVDALPDSDEASPGTGDATIEPSDAAHAGDASDAGVPSEGAAVTACAGDTVPPDPGLHRPLRRYREQDAGPGRPILSARRAAVVRWRAKGALDPASGGHAERRDRPQRMVFPDRHEGVEGVQQERETDRDSAVSEGRRRPCPLMCARVVRVERRRIRRRRLGGW